MKGWWLEPFCLFAIRNPTRYYVRVIRHSSQCPGSRGCDVAHSRCTILASHTWGNTVSVQPWVVCDQVYRGFDHTQRNGAGFPYYWTSQDSFTGASWVEVIVGVFVLDVSNTCGVWVVLINVFAQNLRPCFQQCCAVIWRTILRDVWWTSSALVGGNRDARIQQWETASNLCRAFQIALPGGPRSRGPTFTSGRWWPGALSEWCLGNNLMYPWLALQTSQHCWNLGRCFPAKAHCIKLSLERQGFFWMF